jgi:sugar O-acyltransferase (sialic acid O-acetyltransferase NeuD family)
MTATETKLQNILFGAGGHARALWGTIKACGLKIDGCIVLSEPSEEWQNRCPWLGDDSILKTMDTKKTKIINGLGSTSSTMNRRDRFNHARTLGFDFLSLIHPSAIIADDIELAAGIQIMPGSIIQPGVKVGANVLLNTGCVIEHDCKIYAHTHIAPGAVISGGAVIEEGVHIGTGAVLIQGVKIGKNTLVGAGTVVTEDVPANSKILGNPARLIKFT